MQPCQGGFPKNDQLSKRIMLGWKDRKPAFLPTYVDSLQEMVSIESGGHAVFDCHVKP